MSVAAVFLFLTIKNQMINENMGHYLSLTKGQNAVQYSAKWETRSPYSQVADRHCDIT